MWVGSSGGLVDGVDESLVEVCSAVLVVCVGVVTTVALIADRFAATSPGFARLIELTEQQLRTFTAG